MQDYKDLDIMSELEANMTMLDEAQMYANKFSGCLKVKVGSVIYGGNMGNHPIFGTNRGVMSSCEKLGECNRIKLYGEDSKNHRLPSDCLAIHSEIDAIATLARFKFNYNSDNKTIWVTRYPCEACARAIGIAGIKTVVYGRQQEISEMTKRIFEECNIRVVHCKEWDAEDTER